MIFNYAINVEVLLSEANVFYSSPLRYPGGKRKLSFYIKRIIEENGLCDGKYIEVYAGGAAVALDLLLQEYVKHIYINDLSKSVYAFWHCVLNETEDLLKLINDTPVNFDMWKKQKGIQENPANYSILDLGFSTFFLNRTNRSGIINAGPIGGKNQNGKWKLDARYIKKDLIRRIELIASYGRRISLYNLDAVDFIRNIPIEVTDKSLIYLDPPYYIKGKGLYENYYQHTDHEKLSEVVIKRIKKQKWMISYDNIPQVYGFYKGYRYITYQLNYTAQNCYHGSEVIFFCHKLKIPQITNSKLKIIHHFDHVRAVL